MSRSRRSMAMGLVLLFSLGAVVSCAPPWKKKKKKRTFPRDFMEVSLGMTPKEVGSRVPAMEIRRTQYELKNPSVEVKRIFFQMGPGNDYLAKMDVYYHLIKRISLEDFAKENFAYLGKPTEKPKSIRDIENGVVWERWIWTDRKVYWELRRGIYDTNSSMAEFVLNLRDLAFEEMLFNTDRGAKRAFERDKLRTGDF